MRYMMGNTGRMMQKAGFALCGNTKIYGTSNHLERIKLVSSRRIRDIRFYGEDIVKGNILFRQFVIKPDIKAGVRFYEKSKHKNLI